MRFALLLVMGCTTTQIKPDLSGPFACGSATCGSGQICVTFSAGSQCDVNLDAGIGPYDEISATCQDVPAACNGVPTCDCVGGAPFCGVSSNGREIDTGCI